jgi:iron complex outermembrane receptor protein
VTVITREEIDRSGATNAMELLNLVSANSSLGNTSLTSVIGASTFSAQTASLRGLQGAHTLVLINGKRVNGFAGEIQGVGGVNLAVIPFNAIDRVEILKDGASAVYGSDAIAGVINFILRSDYRGAEVSAYYGMPTRSGGGDQEKYAASIGFGDLSKDRFNVFGSFSYDHQKPLDQVDRNFSNDSTERFVTQLGGYAGSSNTFPGNITTGGIGIPGGCPRGDLGNVPVPSLGIPCAFDPAKLRGVQSIPDTKNMNFFGSAKFQITPTWQAYGTALYSKDENHYIIQPSPQSSIFPYGPNGDLPGNITLPPTSPFYPHALAAAAGVDGQPLDVRWRGFANGFRDTLDTNEGSQLVVGAKGSLMNRWDVDASYSYSKGKTTSHLNSGFFRISQLLALLNSGNVNLFGDNTEAINNQLRATNVVGDVIKDEATNQSFNAKISGELFELPAGPLAVAVGMDLRKEKLTQSSDPLLGTGDVSGFGGGIVPVQGSRDVTAFYGEMNIPIFRTLEASIAIRTDDYSDFGRTNNPKASLRWQPTRDWLFRGSYGQGFLAPSLYQLTLPRQPGVSPTGLSDPIRCPVTGNTGTDCVTQFGLFFGGNPNLRPETSEQATLGAVWEPTNAFSISADYFKIRLAGGITNGIPIATILGDLGQYGNLVTRGPVDPAFPQLPGPILRIEQGYINLGNTHIEGIDVETHYKWPSKSWGRLRFDMSGTYYIRYDAQQTDGSYLGGISNAFGSTVVGIIPRWKHYAQFSLDSGPWSVSLGNTYQSGYVDWQTDFNGNNRRVSSMTLWDLQGVYRGWKGFTFTLGVKNLFDTNPPATNQQNTFQAGYDPSYYDARARFVYGQVRYEFK